MENGSVRKGKKTKVTEPVEVQTPEKKVTEVLEVTLRKGKCQKESAVVMAQSKGSMSVPGTGQNGSPVRCECPLPDSHMATPLKSGHSEESVMGNGSLY